MSKKDVLRESKDITRRAYADIFLLTLDIRKLEDKLNSNTYSDEHKQKVIIPELAKAKREREARREKATKQAGDLAREYMDKQAVLDELRGDQITDDARLLTCGIKLNVGELEKMFDRNAGNGTMQQIICRYVQEQGLKDFRRAYLNHSSACVGFDKDLSYQVDVALKYYNDKNAYERIAGEGGLFDQQIAAAE